MSLNGTEEYPSSSQQENYSETSNVEQNLLPHDDEDVYVVSKSSEETSCYESKTLLDLPDSLSKTSVKDDQKKLFEPSQDLLCNSQDSLKSLDSLDNFNGESSHFASLLTCKFDLDSTKSSASHVDLLGRQKNCEVSEQPNKLMAKNSYGLVKEEVLTVVAKEKTNCTFIMSNSKSLEKTSHVEASPQENVTVDAIDCQTLFLSNENLEEKAVDLNEEEGEEKHPLCSKDPMEIEVIELENILGNLVCEDLIDSGARMLRKYYLSEGVLRESLAELKNEKLESHESKVRLEDGCEPEVILARSKSNSTECETRTVHADQNLAWSQDFSCVSVPNCVKPSQETSSDQQESESSSLQSEDLSGSEMAFSDYESGFVESNRDLFECRKMIQASVDHDVGGKETVQHRTNGEPILNEPSFRASGKLGDIFAQSTAMSYEVASDIGENVNHDMLPTKVVYSARFRNEPVLNDTEKNIAGYDKSVEILHGERHGAMYNRHDASLLLGRKQCSYCTGSNESRPRDSRKFITHSANSRMPHSKQYIARSPFDCSSQCLNSMPDNKVMENNRYWEICDTWYEIYRKQVAWMKYHSWQYRKSAYCCNRMCYNCT